MANATCFTQHAPFEGPPLIQNGQLTFQAHHVGWIIAGFFTIVACVASFWLIGKHLMWYTNKRQQRYIVRLLLMVPIYATVSLASYVFWNHAIPITLTRDCYESFVLYSFFYLLLQYLSPTTEGQKEVFRKVVLEKWVFPLGFVKYRPEDGLYFLQLMKWGVLQYCVIRPTTTLAAVILDLIGLYCEDSWSPGWGHVYITIIVSVSVSIAMYCLIQLYMPIAAQLAPHKPLLKLFSVKAVVFLTFWQATGLSALSMFGVVKDTKYMTAEDINTGIAAILETFEMMCFAFMHVRAFSYRPYRPEGYHLSDQTPRFRSLMHALDLREMWREIHDGSVYMTKTIRGVEAEEDARRRMHFEKIMGRGRELSEAKKPAKGGLEGWIVEDVAEDLLPDRHGRRRGREAWLSEPGDHFGGAFEDEVKRELQRRELAKEYGGRYASHSDNINQGHSRGENSWWKGIYDRLSSSGPDREEWLSPAPRRPSRRHRSSRHRGRGSDWPSLDSPPPPPSIMYDYAEPGSGRLSVRLPHSNTSSRYTQEFPMTSDATREPLLGHHYYHHHKSSFPGIPHDDDNTVERGIQAHANVIVAPRPVSASQSRHMEHLVSRDSRPRSTENPPTNDHDNDHRGAPSGIVRSDSLLARVFPNSTSNTLDGHTSSEGRSNPASSRDTLPIQQMSPLALSQARDDPAGPFSTPILPSPFVSHQASRSPPSKNSESNPYRALIPQRGHPRPNIVLPTPLSPVRYPAESPRLGQGESMFPGQDTENASNQVQSSPESNSDRAYSSSRPLAQPPRGAGRRQSVNLERPLTRQDRTSKRTSAPPEGPVMPPTQLMTSLSPEHRSLNATQPAYYDHDGMLPSWGMSSELSRFPASPTGTVPIPNLMNLPSSSLPVRPLRRSRDDIGKTRKFRP